jgi:hypothetical protein
VLLRIFLAELLLALREAPLGVLLRVFLAELLLALAEAADTVLAGELFGRGLTLGEPTLPPLLGIGRMLGRLLAGPTLSPRLGRLAAAPSLQTLVALSPGL